jgi:hypothetical protein
MMVLGGRITAAEVKIDKREPTSKRNMNIEIKGMRLEKDILEIDYSYTVVYGDDAAKLKIEGTILAKEDGAAKIVERWKKKQGLPEDFSEDLINVINYAGSVNGTIIARVVDLAPPMAMPKLTRGKEGGKAM